MTASSSSWWCTSPVSLSTSHTPMVTRGHPGEEEEEEGEEEKEEEEEEGQGYCLLTGAINNSG